MVERLDRARADLIVILGCADSYELQYKNRYAGEISLELTYFINVSRIMLRLRLRIASMAKTTLADRLAGRTADPEKGRQTGHPPQADS